MNYNYIAEFVHFLPSKGFLSPFFTPKLAHHPRNVLKLG